MPTSAGVFDAALAQLLGVHFLNVDIDARALIQKYRA
jgi:hypothetical protein